MRSAPLDELESAIAAACEHSLEWADPSLEVWAERDPVASRMWMLGSKVGHHGLEAWVRGLTRAAPERARAWFDEHAERDCAILEFRIDQIREALLRVWASIDPERAFAAWVKWENPQPPGGPREVGQLIPPEIYEGLAGLSEAAILAFLNQHPEPVDAPMGLAKFFATNPDRWMTLASSAQAPSTLKKAADAYGQNNPRWTMEHLDSLEPEAREPMIANILRNADHRFESGLKPTLAGQPISAWLEGLSKEDRASVIGGVAGVELMNDASQALTLMQGNNRSQQAREFYQAAELLGAIEPRLMEQQILAAQGTSEAVALLRLAFAAGSQGLFNSPHDAMCRAISYQDPDLRHTAIALTLVNQTDPEVRQSTFEWLEGLPAGTVSRTQLETSLQQVESRPDRWQTLEKGPPIPAVQFVAVRDLLKTMP